MNRLLTLSAAALFVLLVVAASSLFTVRQTEQVLITQFSRPVRLMFNANTSVTCYIAHSLIAGGNCDCAAANPPYCLALPGATVPTEYKSAMLPRSQGITVKPAVGTPTELIFDATSSLTRNAAQLTIDIESTTGGHVRVLTTATGQPRICSVSGHGSAFPVCSS